MRFHGILSTILNYFEWCHLGLQWWYGMNSTENKAEFSISTVRADGLAPIGARPSAGTVMSRFKSFIYTGSALEGWLWLVPDSLLCWHVTYPSKMCKNPLKIKDTRKYFPSWYMMKEYTTSNYSQSGFFPRNSDVGKHQWSVLPAVASDVEVTNRNSWWEIV